MKKYVMLLVSLLFLCFQVANAQTKTVSGVVKSAEDGETMPGVNVFVKGTTQGTITDIDGNFTLKVPEDATALVFSFVGMISQEIAIGTQTTFNVTMEPETTDLEEVVVTALGITKAEKAVGFATSVVKSDELQAVPRANVSEALAGRVAGVSVAATSTEPGAATSISIRGCSSLTGNNEPLWVIDGVPIQTTTVESHNGDGVKGAGSNNINQDDIESMNILKGAAATALYGSRAANGVIIITTKNGSKAKRGFEVEANAGVQMSRVANLPQMQNKFGQGWNGIRTLDENGSWGPVMDGSWRVYGAEYENAQLMQEFKAVKNNVKNFFETGFTKNYGIGVSGRSLNEEGQVASTYYLSYSRTSDDGIIPGSKDKYERNTIAMRGSHVCNQYIKFSSSINLATSRTSSVPTDQGTTVIDGLYEMPRNISIADLQDLSSPFNTPLAYFTEYGITNPYWAIKNNYEVMNQKKLFGKIQADITPMQDLNFTYRFGFDYLDYDDKAAEAKITADNPTTSGDNTDLGSVYAQYHREYEINHDIIASYNKKFGAIDMSAVVGSNINEHFFTELEAEGSDLTIESGWWHMANAGTQKPAKEKQEKRRLVGLFADINLSYNDLIYLDITGRNDWSSTLPKGNNSFFYPGVTASFLFTTLLNDDVKKYITFGKVRAAFGKTGNDADPYKTSKTFVSGYADAIYTSEVTKFPMNNGTNSYKTQNTLGSSDLRPEMTTEWELGTEMKFLNNRIGLDLSYYNRNTDDQIMTLKCEPAVGYTYITRNYGKVSNKGIELMLDFTPVKTKDWEWDVTVNYNKNVNKVIELPAELNGEYAIQAFSTSNSAVYMKAIVGESMGQFYTYRTQYVDDAGNLKYDYNADGKLTSNKEFKGNGHMVVDDQGLPVMTTDVVATGKSAMNKWTGGVSSSLRWKDLTLSGAFDIRMGGYMFSRTSDLMRFTGNGISSTYNDRQAFVIPNSMVLDSESGEYVENTTPLTLYNGGIQDWYDLGGNEGGEGFLINRSFIKLRNVSLSYDIPKNLVSKIGLQNVRLSAVASNLFTWTPASNCFIDPDVSSYGTGLEGMFGELYSTPTSRRFGFNIQVKF